MKHGSMLDSVQGSGGNSGDKGDTGYNQRGLFFDAAATTLPSISQAVQKPQAV